MSQLNNLENLSDVVEAEREVPLISSAKDQTSNAMVPIPVATLLPEHELGFDLFYQVESTNRHELFRDKSYPLVSDDLKRIKKSNFQTLYTTSRELRQYRNYLDQFIVQIIQNEQLNPHDRLAVLLEWARQIMNDSLRRSDLDVVLEEVRFVSEQIVSLIGDEVWDGQRVFDLVSHDMYASTHATNMVVYSLILARELGIKSPLLLREIAVGTMLHDYGKNSFPFTMMSKAAPLTSTEKDTVRRHPILGFQAFSKREDLNWGQLMMIYQHHEWINGGGYPVGLPGKEIHVMARICAVVDVFDALTCQRPYRKASTREQVLEYQQHRSNIQFDEDILSCWISIMTQNH